MLVETIGKVMVCGTFIALVINLIISNPRVKASWEKWKKKKEENGNDNKNDIRDGICE